MDIISHGLWGGLVFGRSNPKTYWGAFAFGIAPDLFSFGILFIQNWLGFVPRPDFSSGPPDPATIPKYVHDLYNTTHSIIIAAAVIGVVWLISRRPPVAMFAWPLHILVDIPTHGAAFFPTPFLWPLTDLRVDGVPWSNWYIFWPNVALLAIAYAAWWYIRRRQRITDTHSHPQLPGRL